MCRDRHVSSYFRRLRDLLNPREQRQALLLAGMMLIMGVLEMVGVASIFPLIAVLSDPEIVQRNAHLRAVYEGMGFESTNSFLIFLSGVMFVVVAARTGFSALTQYAMLHYAQMRSHTLSVRLLATYLGRPYPWFLNRHSADMGKTVLSEVEQVIKGSLLPALELVSKSIVAVCIIAVILIAAPMVALSLILVIGVAYGAIYVTIRKFILRIGQERLAANRQRYQIAQEVLGGVKEVKIGGHEQGYLKRFEKASLVQARRTSVAQVVRQIPRYVLELLAVGAMLATIMTLLIRADGQLSLALPTIGLYGFAAMRLLPVLQGLYQAIVGLRFGEAALINLHEDLFEDVKGPDFRPLPAPLKLREEITLQNVEFSYPKAARPALHNVSLTIPAYSTVGFVGATGAGKSTIIDIMLGLLEPQKGVLKVDGTVIDHTNVRAWQRSVGYVPQQIFLADESLAANIAFGLRTDKIDMQAVERAARMANLHDFIARELPNGYHTAVGERGVRLSGGQRQRVGIARALYHDPDVLVLDEATSALDNVTERAVMEAVGNLAMKKTVILIAHRLSTVQKCDCIFMLEKGLIVAEGSYSELLSGTEKFRLLATGTSP